MILRKFYKNWIKFKFKIINKLKIVFKKNQIKFKIINKLKIVF